MNKNSEINYSTAWLEAEIGGRQRVTQVIRDIATRYDVHGRKVVELGSGIGTNLAVLAHDNDVVGVEGMAEAVARSVATGIPAIQANLEQPIPLPTGDYDWVLCIDVLEHLMNPRECLREAHRLLKSGGGLIINVPNHFDWRGRLRILAGSGIDSQHYFPDSEPWEYPHVRFFDAAGIRRFMKAAGFTVVDDYSHRFSTLPKSATLDRIGLGGINRFFQSRWPDLFGAGYFLVSTKGS